MKTDTLRLLTHSVTNLGGQVIAGMLVRVRATGKDIGTVWFEPAGWMWRTNDDISGTTYHQPEIAADALFLATTDPTRAYAPDRIIPAREWSAAREAKARSPRAVTAVPAYVPAYTPTIVWGDSAQDAPDLTAAIADALARHRR